MEKLVANLWTAVKEKTLQGRKYLVAPVSMIVEGVFSGSAGPILYESSDMIRSVAAWNARPITIGHPELPDGTKASACTPEFLEKQAVGMVLNTKFNKRTKKLQAEAWFDLERLQAIDDGYLIHNALLEGKKLEVSTGLFVDAFVGNGSYNGKDYVAVAKDYKPDHLAIILNGVGACSVADGAGLLVNKAAQSPKRKKKPRLVANAKDLKETVEMVEEAVKAAYDYMNPDGTYRYSEVEEISTNYVIFELCTESEEAYYKQNYAEESGDVKLLGEMMPVTKKVTYAPLVANKKVNMDRNELTAKLGESCSELVANMNDEQVSAISKLIAPAAPAVEQPKSESVVVANSSSEFVEKYAPEQFKNELKEALVANEKIRKDLIDKIIANANNQFTSEELGAMPTAQLNKLASFVVVPTPAVAAPVYAGAAPVANQASIVKEEGFAPLSTLS